ncbi:hypothetical protein NM75_08595 [Dickeya fangzhongdai]|nr:hypothetical protein NM75_08595 [Dickeya fangzhongdai]
MGIHIALNNTLCRISRSASRGKFFTCLGELVWYLAGSGDADHFFYYLGKYKESTEGIHKAIYTTNAIESLNSFIRQAIKKCKVFPTDESVCKVIYLAIQAASKNGVYQSRTDLP